MNNFTKNLSIWAVICVVMIVLFNLLNHQQPQQSKLAYSEFLQKVTQGQVEAVKIQGQKIDGVTSDNQRFTTFAPNDPSMVQTLIANKVQVRAEPEEESPWYVSLFVSWFPMLLLIGVWIFFMRQMQGGGGKALSFGRSKARLISQDSARVTFQDVAGVDEAKEELSEIVQFLSDPKKFTRLGGRIPKGVLLVGSPGTGKTLLARAVAGEAGVPFFSISGSDFVEMFVGVGAARVRDLFVQGKKNAPCLIFIDEIDAVGRQRGAGLGGGHDEREQTLNQLLVEMDGFESNEGVILIAATNRPDVLDPALLRPGRFDRQVVVPNPDVNGRERILRVHAKQLTLGPDVDLAAIAARTPGFAGADLANIINEAALRAARNNKAAVEMADFEEAIERIVAGVEKKTRVMNPKEKETVAYHEAGHALVAEARPGADRVAKISIIPRGIGALGFTQQQPTEDRYLLKRSELLDRLDVLLGGRVAEALVFGEVSTGARDDLQRATDLVRHMVTQYGMSEALGAATLEGPRQPVFLPGTHPTERLEYSERTACVIDGEIQRVLTEAEQRVRRTLSEQRALLDAVAQLLLAQEVIDRPTLIGLIAARAPAGPPGSASSSTQEGGDGRARARTA